ncbi:MAG: hypothetical protein COW84_00010 [Gammaproteobacteria bacterium CG22_combo_CG10-13_8_21_14_all_40_8]|nr:MAG: hypothetical protein COW84_00010 [Gammaproteobacteria bacterium CG22_combo_CG10-13_8_21_14_all_40_8]
MTSTDPSQQNENKNSVHNDTNESHEDKPAKQKSVGLLQIIFSVISAMFGVQNQKNYERDFANGNSTTFIVVGIIMILIFIGTLMTIVSEVIESSGVQ